MRIGRPDKIIPPPVISGSGIALCCIGRRENRYAREFIAHYKALGFDKVFLCDNNRRGEERFEDVLNDYIEEGFVRVLDYRDKSGVQRDAYKDVYAMYGSKYRWMAFFDFDEFLHIVSGENIHELMELYTGYDCVLLNWMNFGDNGLLRDDGRSNSERFTQPLPFDHRIQYQEHPDNDHCKCILRGGLRGVEFNTTPHFPDQPRMKCCNSNGNTTKQGAFSKYDYSVAYLKHYLTKTAEEWALNKWQKGTGNKESIEDFRSRYVGRFFAYNEWTQEKEDVMRELTGVPSRIDPKHRTVVIVNFNTQALTEAAIYSLNKHTPGCRIVVFDNSDRKPFKNNFYNVEVIDNTKGQHIDFEAMLSGYPDKYPTPENQWGSAKHCKTIDYCFDLFPDGFLLMDSDILIKKDITSFFDNSCAWVGNVEIHTSKFNVNLPRVLPYLCYINVPMCRNHGIRYFNGEKMFALSHRKPDMGYDTGCWFYEECQRVGLPSNYICINDYMVHLRHGSWNVVQVMEWLEEHRDLWK